MGIYCGPTPDTFLSDCASLWREHRFAAHSWRAGVELQRRAEFLWMDQHLTHGTPEEKRIAALYGMPVTIDPTLPDSVIELRDSDRHVLGRLENVANVLDVATGPTTRLLTTCRACGDTLPLGASFCIECGEKVL